MWTTACFRLQLHLQNRALGKAGLKSKGGLFETDAVPYSIITPSASAVLVQEGAVGGNGWKFIFGPPLTPLSLILLVSTIYTACVTDGTSKLSCPQNKFQCPDTCHLAYLPQLIQEVAIPVYHFRAHDHYCSHCRGNRRDYVSESLPSMTMKYVLRWRVKKQACDPHLAFPATNSVTSIRRGGGEWRSILNCPRKPYQCGPSWVQNLPCYELCKLCCPCFPSGRTLNIKKMPVPKYSWAWNLNRPS